MRRPVEGAGKPPNDRGSKPAVEFGRLGQLPDPRCTMTFYRTRTRLFPRRRNAQRTKRTEPRSAPRPGPRWSRSDPQTIASRDRGNRTDVSGARARDASSCNRSDNRSSSTADSTHVGGSTQGRQPAYEEVLGRTPESEGAGQVGAPPAARTVPSLCR